MQCAETNPTKESPFEASSTGEANKFLRLQSSTSATIANKHTPAPFQISARRRRHESGAMLLAVLFMMAMMVIVAMALAPAFVQQAHRDREEEMIHRGTEYARAIKKYYKKFGRYPANLEQLENTNQLRFLRRRFKDPLAKDGQWKLLRYGDIQTIVGTAAFAPGAAGQRLRPQGAIGPTQTGFGATGATGGDQGTSAATPQAQTAAQQTATDLGNASTVVTQQGGDSSAVAGGGAAGQAGSGQATGAGQSGGVGGGQGAGATAQPGQTGSNNTIFGNTGVGGQTFGGGAIVGVASKSKDQTIRVYNKKKTYDEWVFLYLPMLDRVNVLLRGPYNGQTFTPQQIGTPAGQANPEIPGEYGTQAPGAPAPAPGGAVQQNQQLTPGNQFPPDQTQPQSPQ